MISIAGFVGAGIALIITVIMFFRLNIIGVVGIISGKTATREIERVWAEERQSMDEGGEVDFFRHIQNADITSGGLRTMPNDSGGMAGGGARGVARGQAQGFDRGRVVPNDALAAMQIGQSVSMQQQSDGNIAQAQGLNVGNLHEQDLAGRGNAVNRPAIDQSTSANQKPGVQTTILDQGDGHFNEQRVRQASQIDQGGFIGKTQTGGQAVLGATRYKDNPLLSLTPPNLDNPVDTPLVTDEDDLETTAFAAVTEDDLATTAFAAVTEDDLETTAFSVVGEDDLATTVFDAVDEDDHPTTILTIIDDPGGAERTNVTRKELLIHTDEVIE